MSTEIAAGLTVMCTNKGILPVVFFRQTCLSSFACVSGAHGPQMQENLDKQF